MLETSIFIKIAWRDLWRHKLRSILTLAAITFGTGLILFVMAFARGEHQMMIKTSIGLFPGYLQIHRSGYQLDKSLVYAMPLNPGMMDYLKRSKMVRGSSARLCADTLVQAGSNLSGARICGVKPSDEIKVSKVAQVFFPELRKLPKGKKSFRRTRGEFLQDESTGEAVLGEDLAKNLQVEVGDEIDITSQDYYGSIAAARFKVRGIFKVGTPDLDGGILLVNYAELSDLLYLQDQVTEIAVALKDERSLNDLELEIYQMVSGQEGPWKVEKTGRAGIWSVQVLKPNLALDSVLQIVDQEIVSKAIDRIPGVIASSPRVNATLVLNGRQVRASGINLNQENQLSALLSRTKPALNPDQAFAHPDWILASEESAKALGLNPGDEVEIRGENYLKEKFSRRLKLAGTFERKETDPEAYLDLAGLQENLRLGENAHQVLLRLKSNRDPAETKKMILARLNYEVIPWQELMPDLVQLIFLDNAGAVIWMMILLVVVAFVVLLTILMSVLERAREFAVMKAIGTRPSEIFQIIFLESFFLGLIGSAAGALLGTIPSLYFTFIPLDFSGMSEYIMEFGLEPYIYAQFEPRMIPVSFAIMLIIVLFMSIFPALRAARVKPVTVLRLQ